MKMFVKLVLLVSVGAMTVGCEKAIFFTPDVCSDKTGMTCVYYEVGLCERGDNTIEELLDYKVKKLAKKYISLSNASIWEDRPATVCTSCSCPSGVTIYGHVRDFELQAALKDGFKKY